MKILALFLTFLLTGCAPVYVLDAQYPQYGYGYRSYAYVPAPAAIIYPYGPAIAPTAPSYVAPNGIIYCPYGSALIQKPNRYGYRSNVGCR